ncbi:16S rRNA m(7)G-527 methyltransferase [Arboricoccus pini]|uniref:Ribosomal RNA small subunit methyltransferase G n=1 Tax=Arboricoccus pini TaxID=1963835 RepID=A0A212R9R0_9PROT|nr:16S rRNA (guanine(527)-N(7))-methyltransferase RsmG [Arboricoccus pini]SNB68745.1 16S rRNA m(7)G-527 methyltransferase [Arboricoccus pini]
MGRAEVAALLELDDVRLGKLDAYLSALGTWNKAINLVAASTLADAWRRHILDSAQLWRHRPAVLERLVDLGSGAGLPGLILAIMGAPEVHLVESDRRKAAFLRDTAARLDLPVHVHDRRIESMTPLAADLVTARALAPLDRLVVMARPFMTPTTRLLFLEGRSAGCELTGADAKSKIGHTARVTLLDSLSSRDGRIVMIDGLNPYEVY